MSHASHNRSRSHSRSRSRSPNKDEKVNDDDKILNHRAKLEQQRQERMKRLRQEMEEEEKQSHSSMMMMMKYPTHENQDSSHTLVSAAKTTILEIHDSELEGMDEEEQMKILLGFGDFSSSKGKKVEDNQNSLARGAAAKNKARKYRQYMNRKGGFNRPLDKMN